MADCSNANGGAVIGDTSIGTVLVAIPSPQRRPEPHRD